TPVFPIEVSLRRANEVFFRSLFGAGRVRLQRNCTLQSPCESSCPPASAGNHGPFYLFVSWEVARGEGKRQESYTLAASGVRLSATRKPLTGTARLASPEPMRSHRLREQYIAENGETQ